MTARGAYLAPLPAVLILGVASKLYTGPGAGWVTGSAGGVLYVAFWVLFVLALAPRLSPGRVALAVFLVTSALECLQLWQPAWLAPVRRSFLGHALLGSTFSWMDFPHYALGALAGWAHARWVRRTPNRASSAGTPSGGTASPSGRS
jgi:hypothetical protein